MGDDECQRVPKASIDRILQRTECPLTWKTPLPHAEDLQQHFAINETMKADSVTALVWDQVILKTKLASAFSQSKDAGAESASRRLIVEAYMRIMPPLWDRGLWSWEDDLVQTYGLALRHFVDATWAHVCKAFHGKDAIAMRHLATFLQEDMVHANGLCGHFQAALVAVRAELDSFPANLSLARRAISMNPDEGHWHCLLAKMMVSARREMKEQGMPWLYSMQEEMTAAQTALRLRKTAKAYLVLSRVHEDLGYHSRAVELLREATETFPNNSFLAWQAADIVRSLPKPHRDRRQAVRWYEQSLRIDNDCSLVHHQLYTLLMERGDTAAALAHMKNIVHQVTTIAFRNEMRSPGGNILSCPDFAKFQAVFDTMRDYISG